MSLLNKTEKEVDNKVMSIIVELDHIYNNKSTDEYKMHGDITRAKVYSGIENMLANLSQLKTFPKKDAAELKNMFNALHRPIYKQMVAEFLHKHNERNSIFTALFTCGYRVLVAELSRIFASTVATEKGLVYKPDRISRNANAAKFIKAFNVNLDKQVDDYIRSSHKKSELQIRQEAYVYQEAGVLGTIAANVAGWITSNEVIAFLTDLNGLLDEIFGKYNQFNPISYMNYVLTDHYDKNVAAFYATKDLYEETLKAYQEYMKLPSLDRRSKIESKYMKNLKKYNIKMDNLRAKIAHYDSRAQVEAKENVKNITSSPSTTSTTSTDNTNTSGGGNDSDNDLDW